jgi:hypothetical protein
MRDYSFNFFARVSLPIARKVEKLNVAERLRLFVQSLASGKTERMRRVGIFLSETPFSRSSINARTGLRQCFAVCDSSCHIFINVPADAQVNTPLAKIVSCPICW